MKRALSLATVALLAAVGLSACEIESTDKYAQWGNDAPVDKSKFTKGVADGPAVLVNMPDGFGNVAVKCVTRNGETVVITTLFHENSPYGDVEVTSDPAAVKVFC